MKVSVFKKQKKGNLSVANIELEALLDRMKVDDVKGYIELYRGSYETLRQPEEWVYYDKLPLVCPTSQYFRKASGEMAWRACNGISVLTVPGLNNSLEIEQVKEKARLAPQTLCAMEGADGHSVHIWTLATLPDGTLPQTKELTELFAAQAYATSLQCYRPLIDYDIAVEAPSLDKQHPQTLDADIYVNPHPTPFILQQPSATEVKASVDKDERQKRLERLKPGASSYVTLTGVFSSIYKRVRLGVQGWRPVDQPERMIALVADECVMVGYPEEETALRLWHYFPSLQLNDVRGIVSNVYSNREEAGRPKNALSKHQLVAYRLREFLGKRYDIRFNEVLQTTEFRTRNSLQFFYRELDRRELNAIHHEALLEGIEPTFSEVDELVHSSHIPIYNPIEDYINSLPAWDGKDHLALLAAMVPNDNPHWTRLFSRWFLSMVAHWMKADMQYANATAPILIGKQGYRKSTFCRCLLPPELRNFFTDSIDFRSNVEAERCLSRFLLVNIDEFDQLNERQFAFVKHLFQKPQTNIRRMYSEAIGTQRRYASFIGTSNQQEVLRDPTGNRRYLCVEVTAPIRTTESINYEQLYAQAKHLILHGERYWLDDEDEALLKASNAQFETESVHEQLFLTAFTVPTNDEDGVWMRPTEIMEALSHLPTFNKQSDNKLEKLGHVLTKLKLKKKRKTAGVLYWVKRIR